MIIGEVFAALASAATRPPPTTTHAQTLRRRRRLNRTPAGTDRSPRSLVCSRSPAVRSTAMAHMLQAPVVRLRETTTSRSSGKAGRSKAGLRSLSKVSTRPASSCAAAQLGKRTVGARPRPNPRRPLPHPNPHTHPLAPAPKKCIPKVARRPDLSRSYAPTISPY